MEPRRKAEGDLSSYSDVCRATKRARLNAEYKDWVTSMQAGTESDNVGLHGLIKRRELVMLIEQALSNLGFAEVSEQLAEESGIKHESLTVATFRQAVLAGDYYQAVGVLDMFGHLMDAKLRSQCKFLIMEQVFLEHLEKGDSAEAMKVLQRELGILKVDWEARLHKLAGCMLCTTPESLREHLNWPGSRDSKNRKELLKELQIRMPDTVMMPEARLEELLEQALTQQLLNAELQGPTRPPVSLLTDLSNNRLHVPTKTVQVLTDHTEEVWHIQFSRNGRWLASASRDASAILWEVIPGHALSKRHTLRGHTKALTFCCWSPDDSMLATCSLDGLVKIWEVETGSCLRTIDLHQGATFTAAWAADGEHIYTSGDDKRIYLTWVHGEGGPAKSWRCNGVNEMIAFPLGIFVLLPYGENKIELWRSNDPSECPETATTILMENDCIVSVSTSKDSTRLLLNMANRALHMWELAPECHYTSVEMVQKFRGPSERHSRFVVRSCFGGPDDCFVLSGSEECKVFVWHSLTGELLADLEGHSGTVNSVSWNPVDHNMFASASDDRSIHIWGLDSSRSECSSPDRSSSDESMGLDQKGWPW